MAGEDLLVGRAPTGAESVAYQAAPVLARVVRRLGWAVLAGLFLFACYQLVRDVAAIFGVHGALIDVGHRPHRWCAPICDYVTLPLEAVNIVTIPLLWRRRRMAMVGVLNLLSIPLWLLSWLAP